MENLRNTAYKVWIAHLIRGIYSRGQEQFDSGYIDVNGKKVSRVNLVGSVIDKFVGENYVSTNLDDGSGFISLKVWQENTSLFLNVEVGDLVLVVGKVKEYNNFRYVTPEVVRKLDNPLWLKIRKLELTREYGESARVDVQNFEKVESIEETAMNVVEEKVTDDINPRGIVLGLVESLDLGDGADFDNVVERSKLGEEARNVINELLKEGELFELHTGKLRVTG